MSVLFTSQITKPDLFANIHLFVIYHRWLNIKTKYDNNKHRFSSRGVKERDRKNQSRKFIIYKITIGVHE